MTRAIIIYVLWAAAVVALGVGMGYLLARRHYEPLLADAHQRIGTLTASNAALTASIKTQNDAMLALEAEAARREAAAKQAIAQARRQAQQHHASAQTVLTEPRRAELTACEDAQSAFAAELRRERGAP